MNAKMNSIAADGTCDDRARISTTSPAGNKKSTAMTIQRLPCRCCRTVSTYSAQSARSRDPAGAR